eukprot:gene5322-33707_t
MSNLGLTIDYGPYGFMDKFDPEFTPNLTDLQGGRSVSVPVAFHTAKRLSTCRLPHCTASQYLSPSTLHSVSVPVAFHTAQRTSHTQPLRPSLSRRCATSGSNST